LVPFKSTPGKKFAYVSPDCMLDGRRSGGSTGLAVQR
jgi:hypothetical protein